MKKLEIISCENVFKKYVFEINEFRLRHEKQDGTMSDELVRLVFERGDSAAALIHDTEQDCLLFTNQFRLPTRNVLPSGWLHEITAGMVEQGEEPAHSMRRELLEEIGYAVEDLELICSVFLSPGGSSERVHVFFASVTSKDKQTDGGGVESEGEDIELVSLPVDEMMAKMKNGEIHDAKTLIALQWFAMNRK